MGAPHQHIRTVVSHRMVPLKGVHNFHPLTRVCNDCGISELENARVQYGKGVPCSNQPRFLEWNESYSYLGGDCFCENGEGYA